MTYNYITANNGVGLSRDMKIFANACGFDNWSVESENPKFVDYFKKRVPPKADVNIYFELIDKMYLKSADRHILIPNPEWFMPNWMPLLSKMDLVLCKTQHALEVFSKYVGEKAVFIGFTSEDRYIKTEKKFNLPTLFMGKSMTKGAKPIYDASIKYGLPLLLLSNKKNQRWMKSGREVTVYAKRLEDNNFACVQNSQGLHVCCSDYEGFGHYINEAKSTGAVIITTNYPPMNELCKKEFAFLVDTKPNRHMGVVDTCIVDVEDYKRVLRDVLKTDVQTLIKMGKAARKSFLHNDKLFKARISKLVSDGLL